MMSDLRERGPWIGTTHLVRPALAGALLAAGCAGSSRPPDDPRAYAPLARELGARAERDGCPHDAGELAERAIASRRARRAAGGHHDDAIARTIASAITREWACLAIFDDLSRDSMGSCAPPPAPTFFAPFLHVRRITGEVFYVGLDPREYAYDLLGTATGIDVELRVRFTGPLADDAALVERMQTKMDRAADLWTRHAPGPIHFRFRGVRHADDAPHFEVHLAPGAPRTPFDVTWGTEWSWHLIAHEIGHMMGLDDEYGQLRKTLGHALGREEAWSADPNEKIRWFQCDPGSLMCDSKGEASIPLPYHYYVILRRRYCRASAPPRDVLAP
jgi:hypothetical protein